jgi:hypothetical protein
VTVELVRGDDMVDAVDHQLLRLLARLPLAPLAVLGPFFAGGSSSLHRHARCLIDGDLVRVVSDPWQGTGRPRQLLYLSGRGLACVRNDEQVVLARQLAARRAEVGPQVKLSKLAPLLAEYELLGLVAATGPGPASLRGWNRPWRHVIPTPRGSARIIRLPAGARIGWACTSRPIPDEYVLVPDTGGLALPALRSSIGGLLRYQAGDPATRLVTVIATTTARRAEAWRDLLDMLCSERRVSLPQLQVYTWAELRLAAGAHEWRVAPPLSAGGSSSTIERATARSSARRAVHAARPTRNRGTSWAIWIVRSCNSSHSTRCSRTD